MIRTTLKGTAVVLALVVVTILILYLNRRDPWDQLPGKQITGEEVTETIDDWSFMEVSTRVILEVRPSDPYSVYNRAFTHDGVLYLNSITPENRWTQFLLQDPNMRLKVGDKIYRVRATRIDAPVLVNAIHQTREERNRRIMGERTPEERERNWYFRVDSR